MSAEQRELMAGNRATLAEYGGAMVDPTLRGRLGGILIPTLVLWGEADRIADPDYGRAFAAAIPGARFRLLTETGHVPQIETPQQLLTAIQELTAHTGASAVSIVGPDDGEVVLDQPVRMRILEDGGATGHREGFYVVSGVARFTVGHESHDAVAGTLVMVPPGAPHTFANPGDEPAVLLNTFTPDLYVQYFRDLHDMITAGEQPTDEVVTEVMGRYATAPATDYR
jgi:uncharacterized RmlC-like cupin family protein